MMFSHQHHLFLYAAIRTRYRYLGLSLRESKWVEHYATQPNLSHLKFNWNCRFHAELQSSFSACVEPMTAQLVSWATPSWMQSSMSPLKVPALSESSEYNVNDFFTPAPSILFMFFLYTAIGTWSRYLGSSLRESKWVAHYASHPNLSHYFLLLNTL